MRRLVKKLLLACGLWPDAAGDGVVALKYFTTYHRTPHTPTVLVYAFSKFEFLI